MKTMTATDAKHSFGKLLDTAQREPVIITKKDRPVGVMLSMQDIEALFKDKIDASIKRGLEDVKENRVHEVNKENLADYVKLICSDKTL